MPAPPLMTQVGPLVPIGWTPIFSATGACIGMTMKAIPKIPDRLLSEREFKPCVRHLGLRGNGSTP